MKNKSPLIEYCAGAIAALNVQYDMTKVLGHAATAGSAREALIQNFLIDHLPEMAIVVSGVIVVYTGKRSKQQDIVLMNRVMPRLRFKSGHDLIFQEGAIATFEIKTSIKSNTVVKEIGENIKSVKKLRPTSLGGRRMGDTTWKWGEILSAIITYEGSSLVSIEKRLIELSDDERPDIYLDMSQGVLIKNNGTMLPQDVKYEEYILNKDTARSLAIFLAIMTNVSSALQYREVKWDRYMDYSEV